MSYNKLSLFLFTIIFILISFDNLIVIAIHDNDTKLILPRDIVFNDARLLESLLEELENFSESSSSSSSLNEPEVRKNNKQKHNSYWITTGQLRSVLQEVQFWSNRKYEQIEAYDKRAKLLMSLLILVDRHFELSDSDNYKGPVNFIQQNKLSQKYLDNLILIYKYLRHIYLNNNDNNNLYNSEETTKIQYLINSLLDSEGSSTLTKELISDSMNSYLSIIDKCNQSIFNFQHSSKGIGNDLDQYLVGILNYIDNSSIRMLVKKVFPKLRFLGNKPAKITMDLIKEDYKREIN